MNLTKTDKSAFVRAVMADVPHVDYNEEARKLVEGWDLEAMPEKVKNVYADPALRHYVKESHRLRMPGCLSNLWTVTDLEGALSEDRKSELAVLSAKLREQDEKLATVEDRMEGLIASFRTLKKAKESLPEELHKYLPADRDATGVTNLPTVCSPVDLLKAMGWPK